MYANLHFPNMKLSRNVRESPFSKYVHRICDRSFEYSPFRNSLSLSFPPLRWHSYWLLCYFGVVGKLERLPFKVLKNHSTTICFGLRPAFHQSSYLYHYLSVSVMARRHSIDSLFLSFFFLSCIAVITHTEAFLQSSTSTCTPWSKLLAKLCLVY
jgi:hypothetical protein